jgi:hypothetical protein
MTKSRILGGALALAVGLAATVASAADTIRFAAWRACSASSRRSGTRSQEPPATR